MEISYVFFFMWSNFLYLLRNAVVITQRKNLTLPWSRTVWGGRNSRDHFSDWHVHWRMELVVIVMRLMDAEPKYTFQAAFNLMNN